MPISLHLLPEKWECKNIVEYIKACRDVGGVPMFKTHYAREPLEYEGKRAVMAVCWGSHGSVPSMVFYDVPEKDITELENIHDDWVWLLYKCGVPRKEIYELYEKGIKIPVSKEYITFLREYLKLLNREV